MSRIPDLKRIVKEDFKAEDRDLVEKLAFPINSFHEQVRSALSGNLDFTNLNQEIKTLNFTTNTQGQPLNRISFTSELNGRVQGIIVVRTLITSDNTSIPMTLPIVSWTQNEKTVNITGIGGLLPETGYSLTILTL